MCISIRVSDSVYEDRYRVNCSLLPTHNMGIPASFFPLFFVPLLLLLIPFSSGAALPGCQARCGDLEIPYPFGIGTGNGRNCSLDPSFEILCNTSSNPPKAYIASNRVRVVSPILPSSVVEVIEIISSESKVRVRYPNLAVSCYDLGDNRTQQQESNVALNTTVQSSSGIDLGATAFALSEDNWITAFGCDDLGTATGTADDYQQMSCLSYCASNSDRGGGNGSCTTDGNMYSGNGCCRVDIPKGETVLGMYLTDMHSNLPGSNTSRRKQYPCSYAFIAEKFRPSFVDLLTGNRIYSPVNDSFSFRFDGLENETTFLNQNPRVANSTVVLDWRIRDAPNCEQAKSNSTSYACKERSECVDYNAGSGGYICRCTESFAVGNPYLSGPDGCQDVDECGIGGQNSCQDYCINEEGGYRCGCPQGFEVTGTMYNYSCKRVSPRPEWINVTIGLAAGVGFLLLLAAGFRSHKALKKRKEKKLREKFFKRNGGLLLQQQKTNEGGASGKANLFPARELDKATDHFNENRILGQGGQGTVYKGMLSDGKIVAIKKSKLIDENQLEQFINEVAILSQISHKNVVKLFGCCLETEVPLLVYEFVPNGTLFELIHDGSTEFPVSWSMRLKIAADIAGALAYLHSASSIPIYHRDIKSSNILLDAKYVAKISDFGTSKSVEVDQTHVTTMVKGTFGYLDPEYFQSSQFTEKSDVYSFGVVLVELLTGQKPISTSKTQEERSLATRFLQCMETNSLNTILDALVAEQGTMEDVNVVAKVAQRCLNLRGSMRPTMKEVAMELETLRMSQMPSTVEEIPQRRNLHESRVTVFTDMEYTWTTGENSATISSSDTRPFIA